MSSPQQTTTTTSPPSPMIKPLVGAATCFCLDTFVFKNTNQKSAMTLAASLGASLFLAPYVAKMLPLESTLSSIGNDGGITAEARLCEVGISLASTYGIEMYVFKETVAPKDITTKMILVIASSFVSEYANDYLSGQKLNYIEGTGL